MNVYNLSREKLDRLFKTGMFLILFLLSMSFFVFAQNRSIIADNQELKQQVAEKQLSVEEVDKKLTQALQEITLIKKSIDDLPK